MVHAPSVGNGVGTSYAASEFLEADGGTWTGGWTEIGGGIGGGGAVELFFNRFYCSIF